LIFLKVTSLTLVVMLLTPILFVNIFVVSVSADTTLYDFVENASSAQWSSGAGVLPFPGDPSDSRGFARYVYNARLEDGSAWSRVLETHPQWVSGGWIMGVYPQQTVPSNTQLTVRVGFLYGATGTDGVRFEVYFDEYRGTGAAPQRHIILRKVATLDGSLDLVTADLDPVAGKRGNFILYVHALQTSNRDWAVWAEARIETKSKPDLVITDIWESSGLIHYKVKNVGDDSTKAGFCNSLSINGQQVAEHCITRILQPEQEVEGVFDYAWQPASGEYGVKVCADSRQSIEESKEGNNCLEERWKIENFPDLIISEVKFDMKSRLIGYVLKNVGKEVAKRGHSTTLYINQREVAHDPVNADLSPGGIYESWFRDYKVFGDISVRVKVCADNYNQVKELDEGNNCMESSLDIAPPSVTVTHSPANVTTRDRVTFSAAATDDAGVTRIVIYLNKTMVKECTPPLRNPQDGKYYCSYEDGPFHAGPLQVTVEAFDPSGNKGVYEEDIDVTTYIHPPPPPPPPIRLCQISGKIYGFPYNRDTLKIRVCEAEQVCAYSINPVTGKREWSCRSQCKMVRSEGLIGWVYSWADDVDVRFVWEFQPYEYSILVSCTGEYLLEPVYRPCPNPTPECQCPWRGSWDASKGFSVRMDGRSQEGYDFTFRPLDTTIPSVTITFSNGRPTIGGWVEATIGEEVEVIVEARDAVEIKYIDLAVSDILYVDGSRGTPTKYRFLQNEFTQYYFDSALGVYVAVVRWRVPNNIYEIAFDATACDDCGNFGKVPLKRLKFAGCPVINFDFGDSGGRVVSSDFPIFGLPDEDGDRISDCWENAAMDKLKPYIEMDEEEDLSESNSNHRVAFFVRVTPYNPYNSRLNFTEPTHILFFFVTTWSNDFGRLDLPEEIQELLGLAHPGDTEPIVMDWSIVNERSLKLEYVYIGAHGLCNKKQDLWSPWYPSSNTDPYCDPLKNVAGTQTLSSPLHFKDNRLYLYVSEDKHATYPSCYVCENVYLVSTTSPALTECFESGSNFFGCIGSLANFVGMYLTVLTGCLMGACPPELTMLLIGLAPVGIEMFTQGVLGLFFGGIVALISDALEDDPRGSQAATWSLPDLLNIAGGSTYGSTTRRLDFRGDGFHYWVEYSVEVNTGEPYSRERPHVRIKVLRDHVADEATDAWGDSEEIVMIVTGFSIHPGGVDVWRVLECYDGDADGGESEWVRDSLVRRYEGNWCTGGSTDVVFEGEVDVSYIIGFVVTLVEDDGSDDDLNAMGEGLRQTVEEMLRPAVEFPTCEGEILRISAAIGEDCGCRKRFRGSEPILLNAYNVGEPGRLVLNNLDGNEHALGGRELAPLDRFPGESVDRQFCGGTGERSSNCASSILSNIHYVPLRLQCAYTPEAEACQEGG
jgi:hypothetical protein